METIRGAGLVGVAAQEGSLWMLVWEALAVVNFLLRLATLSLRKE